MSIISEAIAALRESLRIADDIKRVSATLKDMVGEQREMDRRLTRVEASLDTLLRLAGANRSGSSSLLSLPSSKDG